MFTANKVPPVVDGTFVPDCLEDGRFAEMQCQGSLCWCVDDIGVMKPGTMRVGKPPCYKSGMHIDRWCYMIVYNTIQYMYISTFIEFQ